MDSYDASSWGTLEVTMIGANKQLESMFIPFTIEKSFVRVCFEHVITDIRNHFPELKQFGRCEYYYVDEQGFKVILDQSDMFALFEYIYFREDAKKQIFVKGIREKRELEKLKKMYQSFYPDPSPAGRTSIWPNILFGVCITVIGARILGYKR